MVFKKTRKATRNIALGGLGLAGVSVAAAGIGGPLAPGIGGFTTNIGRTLPAVGSVLGAGLVVGSAMNLGTTARRVTKRRKR